MVRNLEILVLNQEGRGLAGRQVSSPSIEPGLKSTSAGHILIASHMGDQRFKHLGVCSADQWQHSLNDGLQLMRYKCQDFPSRL